MMNPGSGTRSETFVFTDNTTEVTVVPHTISQPMQIARYFTEDLKEFLRTTHIDLVQYLQIEGDRDYPQDLEEVINLLYDDISHMIRDGLLSAINLLISDNQPDSNLSGVFLLRYHATYLIGDPVRSLRNEAAQRFGGYLAPPLKMLGDGNYRFDLLIDWNDKVDKRLRRSAMRPLYLFDWVPETSRFDGSNLVRYRSGGMTMDGATIVSREEAVRAGFLG